MPSCVYSVKGGEIQMVLDEQFDADEILRDMDERFTEEEEAGDNMRELN